MHLPFSEGLQNDDRVISATDYASFKRKNVVVSEKMDGESFSVYNNATHARSLDSGDHPSRSYSKMFAAGFQHLIPEDWRFVFENCYAHHSIFYDDLETYCYLLNIWDCYNMCCSWDHTKEFMSEYGFISPKIYYEGPYDEDLIKGIYASLDLEKVEGLVIRNVETFHYTEFKRNVVKLVRKGHVQTDQHWLSKPVTKNLLKK